MAVNIEFKYPAENPRLDTSLQQKPCRIADVCGVCQHGDPNSCGPETELILKPEAIDESFRSLYARTLTEELIPKLAALRLGLSLLERSCIPKSQITPDKIDELEHAFTGLVHDVLALIHTHRTDSTIEIKNRYGSGDTINPTVINLEKIYTDNKLGA